MAGVRCSIDARYVRTLTVAPASLTGSDADAVYDQGWDEQALHEAIYKSRGSMLREHGYLPLLRTLR